MQRRTFIKNTLLVGGGSALHRPLLAQSAADGYNALRIPPLAEGVLGNGQRDIALTLQSGSTRFLPGLNTPTLGINGNYLGPTLRLRRGERVGIRVANRLAEDTTLHWHGLHVPAIADGGPHQVIQPGGDWLAQFDVQQQAGTFWYHSHLLGKTGDQVYRGLAGMILIDDDAASDKGLPARYGVDDIPLIVQDRRFNADGSFRYVQGMPDVMTGIMGDTVLVNGTYNPLFTATTSLVRLRLLNGANARSFAFAFDDNREFSVVSSGGALLNSAQPARELILAPSERAEILVDVSDGNPVNLISNPIAASSPFAATGMMARMHGVNRDRLQILAIEPQSSLERLTAPATQLNSLRAVSAADADTSRRFVLSMAMGMGMGMMGRGRGGGGGGGGRAGGGRGMMGRMGGMFSINNQQMDMTTVNHRVPVGSTELWEIHNDSMMMHPFHVHHGLFRILDRNGRAPQGIEQGEMDTVKVGPGETVRFLMPFTNFADAEHPYMYHCHILEHEDNGMMGQFTVE